MLVKGAPSRWVNTQSAVHQHPKHELLNQDIDNSGIQHPNKEHPKASPTGCDSMKVFSFQNVCIYTELFLNYSGKALPHWGRVTHICVSKITIIGPDNGLSSGRRQAIFWTNDGILLIGPLGTNFSEILIEIYLFSFKKMHLKMSSGNWQPFCLGPNVLTHRRRVIYIYIYIYIHASVKHHWFR